uniref:Uncharacterized protein n=1 Tax=Anguilla anguilla TaxID=7936 RepID=A0A0E9QN82_ANGAN
MTPSTALVLSYQPSGNQ